MQNEAKQRGWRANRRDVLKARRDNRGYTLQTIIVMSILIAAATGASVVLLRAVSSNTDARSFTDTTGSNAPSRPHSFVVEKTLATVASRTVPSATVRWSPPLYTGFTRFDEQPVEASSASLLYRAEYGCANPVDPDASEITKLADITLTNIPDDTANDPMDNSVTAEIDESKLDIDGPQTHFGVSTELSLPERILKELFPVSMPPKTVYCILRATAYTCPNAPTQDCANPGDNESRTGVDDVLTGSEIYSLESELIRFELSRAPTEILIPEYVVPSAGITNTHNRIDLAWSTPEYTGARPGILYEIKWAQRGDGDDETDFDTATIPSGQTKCTVGNTYSLDLKLDADDPPDSMNELIVDIRITPYATTQAAADAAVPPNFTCPSSSDPIAGEPTDWHDIELVENGLVPDDLRPALTITEVPPPSESVPTDAPENAAEKRTYLQNRFVNLQAEITLIVPETRSYNLENYELQWSRSDGTGIASSRMITAPIPVTYTPNPIPTPTPPPQQRYSSSVILNLENNRAYNFTLIANLDNGETRTSSNCAVISHPKRTPAPALDAIPAAASLRVRIAPQNQANFCNFPIIATPSHPSTQHYKVRVYNPASVCASPGDYPDRQCADDNYSQCIVAGSAAKEIVVTGLTAGIAYEVEVISGHTCNTSSRNIGFTIPSPNPSNYGYPSRPVTARAIPNADVTVSNNLTGIGTTYSEVIVPNSDPETVDPTQKGSWIVSWRFPIADRAIGFQVTVQHRASFDPDMPVLLYVFPFSDNCTSAVDANWLSCSVSIPDDDLIRSASPSPFTPRVQMVTTSGISSIGGTTQNTNCHLLSSPPASLTNLSLPLGCTLNYIVP